MVFVAIRYLDFERHFLDLTLLRWAVASAGYVALLPFMGSMKPRLERKDTFGRDVTALPLLGWASLLYLSLLSTMLG